MPAPSHAPTANELLSTVDTRQIVSQAARNAFGNTPGKPVFDGNRRVGTLHESPEALYCFLEEILPADPNASRAGQTTSIFESIERTLLGQGMEFGHLARTWFYLDRILDWYDDFNQARTPFLRSRGTLLVPASTGIGIANIHGNAVVAGALAIKPKTRKAKIEEVNSPLQCSALSYKSCFSRAVEVARDGRRELYISGTASIEPGGKTAHVGDTRRQIDLTMRVVAAILESRQMSWSDCPRAIAYLKHREDLPLFEEYLEKNDLTSLPLLFMHADVCRDDLLFELEVDAVEGK